MFYVLFIEIILILSDRNEFYLVVYNSLSNILFFLNTITEHETSVERKKIRLMLDKY